MEFLNVNEIEISVSCVQDWSNPHHSFSECATEEEINDIWDKSETNPWQWGDVTVSASYTTPSGKTHKTEVHLCGCSYDNERDFRENSGYFEDMKKEAIDLLCDSLK